MYIYKGKTQMLCTFVAAISAYQEVFWFSSSVRLCSLQTKVANLLTFWNFSFRALQIKTVRECLLFSYHLIQEKVPGPCPDKSWTFFQVQMCM